MLPKPAVNPAERKRQERIRKENSKHYCNWCYKQKSPDESICYDCERSVENDVMMEHQEHSEDSPDYYCPHCREKGWIGES